MFSSQTALSRYADQPPTDQPREVVRVTLPNHRGELVVYCDRPVAGATGEPVFSFGIWQSVEKKVDGTRL